jgi:tellurite resistance protein TehA-like permease
VKQDVENLFPGYFAMVMATGIVSIAAYFLGPRWVAWLLLGLNLVAYVVLWTLTGLRVAWCFPRVVADLTDHSRGPGFFTVVAGTSVLGRQFEFLTGSPGFPIALWFLALLLWAGLLYGFLMAVTVRTNKPLLAGGVHGGWLLMVVATQSLSVLGVLVAHHFDRSKEFVLFFTLATFLLGCALYIVIISLIFYRLTFMPLVAAELTPPYWINMGALAITTLAGATLIAHANEWSLLQELVTFLKGLTLIAWVTATWWIPLLLCLGVWRHVQQRIPLRYDPQYWSLVFPLGMYTVCTHQLSATPGLEFLSPIAHYFVYGAYAAWTAVFLGLAHRLIGRLVSRPRPPGVFDPEGNPVAMGAGGSPR